MEDINKKIQSIINDAKSQQSKKLSFEDLGLCEFPQPLDEIPTEILELDFLEALDIKKIL